MPMDTVDKIVTPELNFPKGGGTIQGLGEAVSNGGMMGTSTLSIPLPISPARSLMPTLALAFSSGAGNSAFGLGFYLTLPAISRRVAKGVPLYNEEDEFLGLGQEILVPDVNGPEEGTIKNRAYQVRRFYARIESRFDKIECWNNEEQNEAFWRVYQADGTQHLFGKTSHARVSDPDNPKKILRWLLEESVSVNGEHILYHYKSEDSEGIDQAHPLEKQREQRAGRYLKRVCYANREGSDGLYHLEETLPPAEDFLFELLFDYGEHSATAEDIPTYNEKNKWSLRRDSFSDYAGGFEIRTHRLCRQVLMFHRFAELGPDPVLVTSLKLEYAQSPIVTHLEAVYSQGYGVDREGQTISMASPPLEFKYHDFNFKRGSFELFKPFSDLPGVNDGRFYQLVDLYGEGLPGIFYRDGSSYLYRAPKRAENSDDPDAIEYAAWQTLPSLPSDGLGPKAQRALMDLTGDGQLDWVITLPGLCGFFSLDSEKNWQNFIPFSTFPSEFNHSRAYLANMMGAGLSDLVLIGPNSVRLYANQRDKGFAPPIEVEYDNREQESLPSANPSETEVVAFSDILGSGQQHLVRIRYNEIVCWPNRGRGQFGKPIQLATLPFSYQDFNAKRVLLADVDGSGASDLLYMASDHVKIFLNQSGNGFAEPYTLSFPPDLRYDDLAQVSLADIFGHGSACLLITTTHPIPQHWVYDFNAGKKSYLLEQMNNNRGLNTQLLYRSSAQEWLDEKKSKPETACHLPFPVQLLSSTIQQDEISGSQFQQRYCYQQGYYDGLEREFRGFAYVRHCDSEVFSSLTDDSEKSSFSPPLLTKVWYYTGRPFIDKSDYYTGDEEAITLASTLYLGKDNTKLEEDAFDETTHTEFRRALSGNLLRQEIFSVEEGKIAEHPYQVSAFRYQIRVQQEKGRRRYPVLFSSLLEQISYQYDKVPNDPRCDHQITINIDRYGVLTESVAINYPRRGLLNKTDPYFDEEQFVLRLQRSFVEVVHLDQSPLWRLGLAYQDRSEVTVFPAPLPEAWQGALSYEKLVGEKGLLATLAVGDIIAWNHYQYWSLEQKQLLPLGEASAQGLLGQVFSADIKQSLLDEVLSEIPEMEDNKKKSLLEKLLDKSGGAYCAHRSSDKKLPEYYWIPSNQANYDDIEHFFRVTEQTDPFGNKTSYDYDPYSYRLSAVRDALGSQVEAQYNYRLLQVCKTKDPNELTQEYAYDPLGRLMVSTFRGYEADQEVGFELLDSYHPTVMTLQEIIEKPKHFIQKAASAYFYDAFSWMGKLSIGDLKKIKDDASAEKLFKQLQERGFITQTGHIKSKARWQGNIAFDPDSSQQSVDFLPLLKTLTRTPPHVAVFVADEYANQFDSMQVRISLSYTDGFDRTLQTKQLMQPGNAYQVNEKGELHVENNVLVEKANVLERWVVSARIDYNNKGFPVRKYQPYFIDTYHYVKDSALQKYGFYDSVFYDALGRALKLVNASGFFQRYTYHPWFLHHEDENDTWTEVLEKGFT